MTTASLQRGKTPILHNCPAYDAKQYDGKVPVLELWEMWSTPSSPLLPGLLWPEVKALDRVQCIGQIELFDMTDV